MKRAPDVGTDVTKVTFYFDPACPWTWRTSRWLVDITQRHGVDLAFRSFELSAGGDLDDAPEKFRAVMTASRSFLRAVEVAHTDGRDDLISAAYGYYGQHVHDEGAEPSLELVEEAWRQVGGESYLPTLRDGSNDEAVVSSRAVAVDLAGDDAGSPVLVFATADLERGFFGPVVAPTPNGVAAERLWEAVTTAVRVPEFFELKTRRTQSPGARPPAA